MTLQEIAEQTRWFITLAADIPSRERITDVFIVHALNRDDAIGLARGQWKHSDSSWTFVVEAVKGK